VGTEIDKSTFFQRCLQSLYSSLSSLHSLHSKIEHGSIFCDRLRSSAITIAGSQTIADDRRRSQNFLRSAIRDPRSSAIIWKPALSKSITCRQQRAYHSSKFLSTGTALGKGVYFARDASFSMKYTLQGTGGGRYMYLARVLVGRYCHGDPKLVVPPSRDPSRPEILFDSVVDNTANPGIFVVFSDSQCYPDYLITF